MSIVKTFILWVKDSYKTTLKLHIQYSSMVLLRVEKLQ